MAETSFSSKEPIGYIVGESRPQEFTFVSSPTFAPPRLEYLVVPDVEERVDGKVLTVDVLAQVSQIGIDSAVLSDGLTYEETRTILRGDFSPPPKVLGKARVIGYISEEGVKIPRCAAIPGQPVYIASDELLREFFSRNIESGIRAGSLINRAGVEVVLDPNGLRRHLAVIAQTGAGKSYLVGKILESLIGLGATVIIFDPNSDYVQLRKVAEDAERPYNTARKTPFAGYVDIYRIPGIKGRRYPDEMIGPREDFTVRFSQLELEEICELAGISSAWTNLRKAIEIAVANLRQRGQTDFRPEDLLAELKRCALEGVEGAEKAARRVQFLCGYGVWGYKDVDVDKLLRPKRISVFDLAGGESHVMAYVADRVLREIWTRATTGRLAYPVFVVLEEAHNLAPGGYGRSTRASHIISQIASEGRKFRVFLIIITQRPSKIDDDVLSQCGSQIIMQLTNPEDQRAVRMAAEAISEELLRDLPALNKGEAVVLGQLTRVPVMIKVGQRLSAEGGSDIDLIEALRKANEAAEVEARFEETPAPTKLVREEALF